jgi:hypothetical protein
MSQIGAPLLKKRGKTGEYSGASGPKRNASASQSLSVQIAVLQNTAGNQAVQKLFRSGFLQTKLTAGSPDDLYEQEADKVADAVMRMPQATVQMKPG